MFFTTEHTENTEEKLEFGGRVVSVKTAKANLPQRSQLKGIGSLLLLPSVFSVSSSEAHSLVLHSFSEGG